MEHKKTVFVSGHFNVIHPGHLRVLRFAKECGNYLIIGLESDKMAGKDAHVKYSLRYEGLMTNSWVDEVVLMDEPASDLILKLRPDIVVKGKEFQSQYNAEEDAIKSYGGELLFSSGESVFSSIDLLRKEIYEYNQEISLPDTYLSRHSIKKKDIINLVKSFREKKVCVIGDLIVDEYITCEALGMSQEEPTLVVTPIDSSKFIGGAGIVAAHASGLGSQVTYLSVIGNDETGKLAEKFLKDAQVNSFLLVDEHRPTTLKQRFRSKGKGILRVNHLRQSVIDKSQQLEMLKKLKTIIEDIDLLVFSDFNYGCLPTSLVDEIISIAKKNKVMIAADSQSSSQMGDISRFHDMDLITPTEREARISLNNYEDNLVILADKLRRRSNCKNILLKLGEEGLIVHGPSDKNWLTDRISALNELPRDVAGAGDSLLITSALVLACGGNMWEASLLGSLAAAIQVGRVGNTPLTMEELIVLLSG
jgi:rfaE bifunctional protein kinase chain/domain